MTDPVKILFDSFNVFAAAPGGVKKLKELILQLAVQGKLVEQDPNDEPASELLKKIKTEKERLVAEGKIKKSKPLPPIEPDEVPFEVPEGWEWVRLGDALPIFQNGASSRGDKNGKEITVIRLADIYEGRISLNAPRRLTISESAQDKYELLPSDVLIIRVNGSADIVGKFIRCDDKYDAIYCDHFIRMRFPIAIFDMAFLEILGNSKLVRNSISDLFISTAGQKTVNQKHISSLRISLPPLAEQHRIVARVDQLMGLCDELEAKYNARQEQRQTLNAAALETILTAKDQAEFDIAWQQVVDSFDLLYDDPGSVPKLRQAILQLAVMGKLVPQDPNDEPASELLKKIKTEKKRLVSEGKIKKPKPLPPIEPDEVPFEVPEGWAWGRYNDLAEIIGGVTKGRKLEGRKTTFFPYLRVANVQRGYLDLHVMKEIEIPIEELDKYRLAQNDLLLTEGGDWDKVGRTAIWNCEIDPCIHQNHVFRARLVAKELYPKWIAMFTNSPAGRIYFEGASKQTTNLASINMTQLRHCPLPIPSEKEQHRIVARVDQLMVLCDEMEAKLNKVKEKAESLVSAVVGQFQNISESQDPTPSKQEPGSEKYGYKYLYGKYENFKPLLENGAGIRFTDIYQYVKLENEAIRDDESRRECSCGVTKMSILFEDGRTIENQVADNTKLTFATRRCFTLCLSNRCNSAELFNRFEADVCIKIDIDKLMGIMRNCGWQTEPEIDAQAIYYFKANDQNMTADSKELVFHKNELFRVEDEFRIALFLPFDQNTMVCHGDTTVSIFGGDNDCITLKCDADDGMRAVVTEAILSDGTVVYPSRKTSEAFHSIERCR